jgi:Ca2+-transporting ATPase
MITGDHRDTALSIGTDLSLAGNGEAVTGVELAAMDDERLQQTVRTANIFARVAPEHKLRLVKALQRDNHIVAMTGDGVNDAPSLKQANIGVAMGITGTAVSQESADIVLADDNFASISAAVEEGRRVYDNLIKSLAFLLPTNLGLALILIYGIMFFPFDPVSKTLLLPMLPTQLLWINLVAAVALALPLAFEVKEPDIMDRPPRPPEAPLFTGFIVFRVVLVSLLMTAGTIGLFDFEYRGAIAGGLPETRALAEAQTMAVTFVIFFQVFYMIHCRSLNDNLLKIGFFSNPIVFMGIGVVLALQALFIYLPLMQRVFKTASLSPEDIGLTAAAAFVIFPVITLEKWVRSLARNRRSNGL